MVGLIQFLGIHKQPIKWQPCKSPAMEFCKRVTELRINMSFTSSILLREICQNFILSFKKPSLELMRL